LQTDLHNMFGTVCSLCSASLFIIKGMDLLAFFF